MTSQGDYRGNASAHPSPPPRFKLRLAKRSVRLTVGVGGDGHALGRRARAVAVDRQHAHRVLRELVEAVHLVAESAHLHTLPTGPEVVSMRVGVRGCRV